jgi:creatinine amidohydrolase
MPRLHGLLTRTGSAILLALALVPTGGFGQANPLWTGEKIKNYLPHMTWPEVEEFLTHSDMVIFPVGAVEQHGLHLPLGTDYLNGVERAKLIAQRTDVVVAPVLLLGQSPYHMGFPGTLTLSAETIQQVFVEAAQSLIHHGFKRFLILNAHGGNRAICQFIVDRINQETEGIAVELGSAAGPYMDRVGPAPETESGQGLFDRHAGVGETSNSLYLTPTLVQLDQAVPAALSMPDHLDSMVPLVLAGDPVVTTVFLAEGLKAAETGKGTSAREMSSTGVWGVRNPKEATAEQGRDDTERFVAAAVRFIDRWRELRPMGG